MGIVSASVTFNDQARQRADDSFKTVSVKTFIYAPDTPGEYPVIVYSHGTGEPGDQSAPHYAVSFAKEWAAQGYIVVTMAHTDAADATFSQTDINDPLPSTNDLQGATNGAFYNRVADMVMGLDKLPSLLAALPNGSGYSDSGYHIAAGFSFGGGTAELAAGVELKDNTGAIVSYGDDRFDAVVNLSAGATGVYGLFNTGTVSSWSNFTKPIITLAGDKDTTSNTLNYQAKLDPYDLSPATGGKHAFVFSNATHFAFGGGGVTPAVHAEALVLTSAFLDAYAKGDTGDLAFLKNVDGIMGDNTNFPRVWQALYNETDTGSTLTGTNVADLLVGTDANDTIYGYGGADEIYGGMGNDIIDGGYYNDYLVGGSGRDTLFGNTGDDVLIGGFDNDVLTGGAGSDRFAFTARGDGGGSGDIITDFVKGVDVIDVSVLLASMGVSASSLGGYIDVRVVGGDSLVVLDVNNNSTTNLNTQIDDEVLAVVKGVTNLAASDFFF